MNSLASFIREMDFPHIPPEVVEKAKRLIIDGIGVGIRGFLEEPSQILIRTLKPEEGGCPILGSNLRASPLYSSLINGVSIHSLDFDDYSEDFFGHPTAAVLPPALSLSKNGRELLLSYIVGVEVACALGKATGPRHYEAGWHSTSVLGIFGACASSSKLLSLDHKEIKRAMGIASSLSSGIRKNFGTHTKPLQVGMASRNGLLSSILAKEGFSSNEDSLFGDMGFLKMMGGEREINFNEWRTLNVAIKPYPCCSDSHRIIDASLELREKIKPEDIEEIIFITPPQIPKILIYKEPKTKEEAKFSLPFIAASTLIYGKPDIKSFENLSDEKIKRLIKISRFEHPPDRKDIYSPCSLKLKLKDKELEAEVQNPKGSSQNPLKDEELYEKFKSLLEGLMDKKRIKKAFELLLNLEKLENLEELFEVIEVGS